MAAARTIIVAGAGIGGLTAALSLAAKGFRVVILEKAERLEEAGAGLQLSPNASRILVDLGLRPRLAPRAVTPEAVNIMSARAGGEIARLPLGEAASLRAGAPYWVMHRADLQAALQAQVNDHPDIDLRLGCQFEDVTSHAKGLTVVQRRGNARQQELAVALVGADGIWSAVRNHFFPFTAFGLLLLPLSIVATSTRPTSSVTGDRSSLLGGSAQGWCGSNSAGVSPAAGCRQPRVSSPRCAYAARSRPRPRGVRCRSPHWSRNGS